MPGQVSWLASPSGPPSLLSVDNQPVTSGLCGPPQYEAYSCGDSSGLEPDSLFSRAPQAGFDTIANAKIARPRRLAAQGEAEKVFVVNPAVQGQVGPKINLEVVGEAEDGGHVQGALPLAVQGLPLAHAFHQQA